MPEESKNIEAILRDILSEAEDLTDSRFSYVNNIHINVGLNEVTLDMYYLGPDTNPSSKKHRAQRLHRIVLPISVAKETAQIILAGVANWEDSFGITLPLSPQNIPEQQIGSVKDSPNE